MNAKFGIVFGILLLFPISAPATEFVFQDFDSSPLGSVTNTPGWTVYGSLNALTGRVTNVNAYSQPNCLELQQPPGGAVSNTLAIYTNLLVRYPGSGNPIMRFSTMLYRQPTNGWQNMFISLMSKGAMNLSITTDPGDGTIRFNHIGGFDVDTGVRFASNRYANLTLLYNVSNNLVALDYDGTNILPWTSAGGITETQVDSVVVGRMHTGAAVERAVLFDDFNLVSFPDGVWAWWRFEEGSGNRVAEQLGHFSMTNDLYPTSSWVPAMNDLYYDGDDVHNRYGLKHPATRPIPQNVNTPAFSNWTVEVIFRALPASSGSFDFFDWGVGSAGVTTNSWISFGWQLSSSNLFFSLRDAHQPTANGDYIPNMGFVRPDGCWHHVAGVKQGDQLTTYIDYLATATNTLNLFASSGYYFETNAWISIGQSLSSGNSASTNVSFDEIRITTHALSPKNFLLPSRPVILSMPADPQATNWSFRAQTPDGKTNRVYLATNAMAGAQKELTSFVSTGIFNSFTVAAPTQKFGIISMQREKMIMIRNRTSRC